MGPSGKAGTTQPNFIHFTDAFFVLLLPTRKCHNFQAWLTSGRL